MRVTLFATCLFGVAVAFPQFSVAESPNLPPAEYKPLPVGAVIDYDSWTCEVIRSNEVATNCRDPDGARTSITGHLVPYGKVKDAPPLKWQAPFMLYGTGFEYALKLKSIELDQEAQSKILSLWPLKVGNSAKYKPKYDADNKYGSKPRLSSHLKVKRMERVQVSNAHYDSFVIVENARRSHYLTRGGLGSDDNFRRTIWYAPALGVVVKEKFEWTTGGARARPTNMNSSR